MSLRHHPYTGFQDFITMTSILSVGRKISQRPYYVHTGDLSWWMFYSDHDDTYWCEHICIWDHDEQPCGWSLIDCDWSSFDVYLLPEMRGSKEEVYILDWTIQKLTDIVRQKDGHEIRTMWVSEQDHDQIEHLQKRGFSPSSGFMWYLEQPLKDHILEPELPPRYVIRSLQGENESHRRAAASYNAFDSTRQFDEYWPRYQRFMRSPVYNPNFDLVVESPDGQVASFCIIWPDPVNHIGLFEPVGTQTEFQHKGLGRAVVTAGLRTLRACGMDRAMVCVENDNTAALKLYEAVGFEVKHKLLTYAKTI
jgi:ribosomal protein S18 acetylase RimI-like enzyme